MRLKSKTKLITTLVSFLMIGAAAISSTVAFLYTYDDPVVNKFIPSKVTTAVVEDIEPNPGVKSDVKIANTGDTTAWIRAAVVVTWQDKEGNVYGQMPVIGVDCETANCTQHDCHISYDKTKWGYEGGFWYCKDTVPANTESPVLITSCKPTGTSSPKEGYYLTVEILGSGIQTFQGVDNYKDAWKKVVEQ